MDDSQHLSEALRALLDIITSEDLDDTSCIDAARHIIEYEAPVEVFDLTYEYLMSVARNPGKKVGLKLEALKLLRKVEAKRVVPGTTKAADMAQALVLGRRLATARRRLELSRDGRWPPEPGWDEGIEAVAGVTVSQDGIAEMLKEARVRRIASSPSI